MKKFILYLVILSLFAGCANIKSTSQSSTSPASSNSSSTYEEREKDGFKTLLGMIGMALVMGVAFKTAPKEAYK